MPGSTPMRNDRLALEITFDGKRPRAPRTIALLRRVGAIVAALLTLFGSARAQAFCRTTTITVPLDFEDVSCFAQGLPLYHASRCVPYQLLATESPVIPNAVLSEKLAA